MDEFEALVNAHTIRTTSIEIGGLERRVAIVAVAYRPEVPTVSGCVRDLLFVSERVPEKWRRPILAFIVEYARALAADESDFGVKALDFEEEYVMTDVSASDRDAYTAFRVEHFEQLVSWCERGGVVEKQLTQLRKVRDLLRLEDSYF